MLCKRGLRHLAVSVRPSVTFVNPVKTNKHIFKIFSLSGSQTILDFPYQTSWQCSDSDPVMGASNAGEVGKNCSCRRIAGYRSMTGGVRTTSATVHRAVYGTDGDA